ERRPGGARVPLPSGAAGPRGRPPPPRGGRRGAEPDGGRVGGAGRRGAAGPSRTALPGKPAGVLAVPPRQPAVRREQHRRGPAGYSAPDPRSRRAGPPDPFRRPGPVGTPPAAGGRLGGGRARRRGAGWGGAAIWNGPLRSGAQALGGGEDGAARRADYVERTFPRRAQQSRLARAARLDLLVGLDVRGPGGGQWSCRWMQGELAYVRRGLEEGASVVYHTDPETFDAILEGRQSPQEAFFEQRIAIAGDLEAGLKLAALLAQFLREDPDPRPHRTEAMDAIHS